MARKTGTKHSKAPRAGIREIRSTIGCGESFCESTELRHTIRAVVNPSANQTSQRRALNTSKNPGPVGHVGDNKNNGMSVASTARANGNGKNADLYPIRAVRKSCHSHLSSDSDAKGDGEKGDGTRTTGRCSHFGAKGNENIEDMFSGSKGHWL